MYLGIGVEKWARCGSLSLAIVNAKQIVGTVVQARRAVFGCGCGDKCHGGKEDAGLHYFGREMKGMLFLSVMICVNVEE
jgi:hypothetical protein